MKKNIRSLFEKNNKYFGKMQKKFIVYTIVIVIIIFSSICLNDINKQMQELYDSDATLLDEMYQVFINQQMYEDEKVALINTDDEVILLQNLMETIEVLGGKVERFETYENSECTDSEFFEEAVYTLAFAGDLDVNIRFFENIKKYDALQIENVTTYVQNDNTYYTAMTLRLHMICV
ncbi:MAG: hypothetical protein ACRCSG_08245 [Cellulosilyticaceae bacterium]